MKKGLPGNVRVSHRFTTVSDSDVRRARKDEKVASRALLVDLKERISKSVLLKSSPLQQPSSSSLPQQPFSAASICSVCPQPFSAFLSRASYCEGWSALATVRAGGQLFHIMSKSSYVATFERTLLLRFREKERVLKETWSIISNLYGIQPSRNLKYQNFFAMAPRLDASLPCSSCTA